MLRQIIMQTISHKTRWQAWFAQTVARTCMSFIAEPPIRRPTKLLQPTPILIDNLSKQKNIGYYIFIPMNARQKTTICEKNIYIYQIAALLHNRPAQLNADTTIDTTSNCDKIHRLL